MCSLIGAKENKKKAIQKKLIFTGEAFGKVKEGKNGKRWKLGYRK